MIFKYGKRFRFAPLFNYQDSDNESMTSIHVINLLPDETEEMMIEKFSYFGSSKFQCRNFHFKSGQKYAKLRMEVLKMAR